MKLIVENLLFLEAELAFQKYNKSFPKKLERY